MSILEELLQYSYLDGIQLLWNASSLLLFLTRSYRILFWDTHISVNILVSLMPQHVLLLKHLDFFKALGLCAVQTESSCFSCF